MSLRLLLDRSLGLLLRRRLLGRADLGRRGDGGVSLSVPPLHLGAGLLLGGSLLSRPGLGLLLRRHLLDRSGLGRRGLGLSVSLLHLGAGLLLGSRLLRRPGLGRRGLGLSVSLLHLGAGLLLGSRLLRSPGLCRCGFSLSVPLLHLGAGLFLRGGLLGGPGLGCRGVRLSISLLHLSTGLLLGGSLLSGSGLSCGDIGLGAALLHLGAGLLLSRRLLGRPRLSRLLLHLGLLLLRRSRLRCLSLGRRDGLLLLLPGLIGGALIERRAPWRRGVRPLSGHGSGATELTLSRSLRWRLTLLRLPLALLPLLPLSKRAPALAALETGARRLLSVSLATLQGDDGGLGEPRGRLSVVGLGSVAGRFSFAAIALGVPLGVLVLIVLGVVGAPSVVLVLRRRPLVAFSVQSLAPGPPIGGRDGLALLTLGGFIDRPRPGQVAARQIGPLFDILVRQRPAVAVIDHHEFAALVPVAVVGVTNQERLIVTGPIIIVAIAAGARFDHLFVLVVGDPDPRANAVIVEGVVRRRVGEGVAHRIAAIGKGVAVAGLSQPSHPHRRRGWQGVGGWRVHQRRRQRVGRQGHGGGGRRGLLHRSRRRGAVACGQRQGRNGQGHGQARGMIQIGVAFHVNQIPNSGGCSPPCDRFGTK